MAPQIVKLPVPPNLLGEGPHWDSDRQTLYYVDLLGHELHRYVPATKEHAKAVIDTDKNCSFIIPLVGHPELFAVNLGHQIHVLRWDGQDGSKVDFVQVIAELDMENPANVTNDGKVDSRGRLFTGTVGIKVDGSNDGDLFNNSASFYSVSGEGTVKKIYSGVTVSNGIVFDTRRKALFHVDTFVDVIRRLDYNVQTGEASNERIVFTYKENKLPGHPDGMTIDTDGNLWVASYEGFNVVQFNPDNGKVLRTVEIPDKKITSVTFGGPGLDILYVTSGGGTYAVAGLGVHGYKSLNFNFKALNI